MHKESIIRMYTMTKFTKTNFKLQTTGIVKSVLQKCRAEGCDNYISFLLILLIFYVKFMNKFCLHHTFK